MMKIMLIKIHVVVVVVVGVVAVAEVVASYAISFDPIPQVFHAEMKKQQQHLLVLVLVVSAWITYVVYHAPFDLSCLFASVL